MQDGSKQIRRAEVEQSLKRLNASSEQANQGVDSLNVLWKSSGELGVKLAAKVSETAQAGSALVASAPTQIVNPKLLLHLDLIVKGLDQSVSLVKDTGGLLSDMLG